MGWWQPTLYCVHQWGCGAIGRSEGAQKSGTLPESHPLIDVTYIYDTSIIYLCGLQCAHVWLKGMQKEHLVSCLLMDWLRVNLVPCRSCWSLLSRRVETLGKIRVAVIESDLCTCSSAKACTHRVCEVKSSVCKQMHRDATTLPSQAWKGPWKADKLIQINKLWALDSTQNLTQFNIFETHPLYASLVVVPFRELEMIVARQDFVLRVWHYKNDTFCTEMHVWT